MKRTFNAVKEAGVWSVQQVSAMGRSELAVAVGAGTITASNFASAALDASIASGLTSVQSDFTALLALAYPVMISVTGAVVLFSLAKGFIHRAFGK